MGRSNTEKAVKDTVVNRITFDGNRIAQVSRAPAKRAIWTRGARAGALGQVHRAREIGRVDQPVDVRTRTADLPCDLPDARAHRARRSLPCRRAARQASRRASFTAAMLAGALLIYGGRRPRLQGPPYPLQIVAGRCAGPFHRRDAMCQDCTGKSGVSH